MIKFDNGHCADFFTASGSMGFYGEGWWFEKPSRWIGSLRPGEFTIIIKTLTYCPRKGNYRWWAPWRSVQPFKGGFVNAVGLSNPGYKWWTGEPYRHICRKGYKAIVSVMPENVHEAAQMMTDLNTLRKIVGVQLNLSCPNVSRNANVEHVCELTTTALKYAKHPVSVKLSYQDDYVAICRELDGRVAAFELINSVPFNIIYPENRSPLAKYNLAGAVSGRQIKKYAVEALLKVKHAGLRTPVISGGGIDGMTEVLKRQALGADGIVFGSIFITRPGLPNMIANACRKRRELQITGKKVKECQPK